MVIVPTPSTRLRVGSELEVEVSDNTLAGEEGWKSVRGWVWGVMGLEGNYSG